jgi:hypothetical protein
MQMRLPLPSISGKTKSARLNTKSTEKSRTGYVPMISSHLKRTTIHQRYLESKGNCGASIRADQYLQKLLRTGCGKTLTTVASSHLNQNRFEHGSAQTLGMERRMSINQSGRNVWPMW